MAGRGREPNPEYRGVGSNQNFLPGNVLDESDQDAVTRAQMGEKYHHLRRVAEGRSELFLRKHGADEVFGDVYPEFLNLYSRGQLQHLEKLFLMADQDEDLQLNSFELTYWMEKQNNPITQQELKQIFLLADENQDGLLSFREFLLFCQKINLKNIPEDKAGVPGSSIMEDAGTSGQSGSGCSGKHYPPGHFVESHQNPDTGPTKLRNAVLPQVQEHGKLNLNNAIQFFETEIARETEAAAKNRQVNVDLFKHKKKRRKEAITAAPTQIPKTYRTTVTMEVKAPPAASPVAAQEERLQIEPHLATTTYKTSLADLKGHGAPPSPPPIRRQHETLQHASIPPPNREFENKETQAPCVAEVLETLDETKTRETVDGASKPRPASALPPVPPPLPLPPPRTLESKPSKEIQEQVQLVEPLVTTPPLPPTLSIPTQTELQIMLSSGKPEVDRVDQSTGQSSIHLPDPPPLPITVPTPEIEIPQRFRNSITSTESLEFMTPIQSNVLLPRPHIPKSNK